MKFAITVLACVFLGGASSAWSQQKPQWIPGQVGLNAGILPSPGFTYVNMDINYDAGSFNDRNGNAVPVTDNYNVWWRFWWRRISPLGLISHEIAGFGGITMLHVMRDSESAVRRVTTILCVARLVFFVGALSTCGNTSQTLATERAAQKVFATPDHAGAAFLEAARSGDQATLLAIFGPDGKTALFSGDAAKDKDNLQDFVAAYNQMHRWRQIKVVGEVLYVGADNYPFPIPLGKNAAGLLRAGLAETN